MAELAGRIGDGLIGTAPDKELLKAFKEPAASRTAVRPGDRVLGRHRGVRRARTAHEWWPTAALQGEVTQELPNPAQFTDLVQQRDRGPGRRGDHLRPGPGRAPGEDPGVHRRGVRPRVPAPGRAGPGGLPATARARSCCRSSSARRRSPSRRPSERRAESVQPVASDPDRPPGRGFERCSLGIRDVARRRARPAPSLSQGLVSSCASAVPPDRAARRCPSRISSVAGTRPLGSRSCPRRAGRGSFVGHGGSFCGRCEQDGMGPQRSDRCIRSGVATSCQRGGAARDGQARWSSRAAAGSRPGRASPAR